ncbi:NADP oxidoreductase [Tamlana haliotis]|uniref:NADP oxidoreductase n=1 Tax=Pseudotamlana haliotis TaxID=2614804 RepID=A0A6N6MEK1_9FLAO|nr:NAD(P)-binding domain-containing protein [Tamlana haliotis]KAB1067748.1 NADP oxidoreductase [Tamlana haliotis]
MKIGIIGSGNLAGSLGKCWEQIGHEVLFGTENSDHLQSVLNAVGKKNAVVFSVNDVFEANADAYLLAMPFKSIEKLAERYAGTYEGKIIIDATNPDPDLDGAIADEVLKANYNASEYTAVKFSTAKIVKAFNTIAPEDLETETFRSHHQIAIPYAVQDAESKHVVEKLIQDIGFDAFYIGDLSHTNIMDPHQALYRKSLERPELKRLIESARIF